MGELSCDVIISVYNGLNEVRECIDSVLKHSGKLLNKVIIINDSSPDPRIRELINRYAISDRVVVVHNQKNLGYLRTCNKAYSYTEKDVVFLNSDTVVTKEWLQKMLRCAYSRDNIGVVSPFTNNDILCSIPSIGTGNVIPEGMTLERYAGMIEDISMRKYPVLPSAFGFCMLVKRRVIEEVGLFDEVYGNGYYEENDFCCRARGAGFDCVLCDDTYIYHYGSVSFSEDKYEFSRKNEKIINQRFPFITSEISDFINFGPLSDLALNVLLHTKLKKSGRKNLLFVLHKNPFDDTGHMRGGVELHVMDMVDALKSMMNCFVLYPVEEGSIIRSYAIRVVLDTEVVPYNFRLPFPALRDNYCDNGTAEVISAILTAFRIDLVHIHHLIGMTCDICAECRRIGVPYVFTVHDLYMLCRNYSFIRPDGKYCGCALNPGYCSMESCFGEGNGNSIGLLTRHRKLMSKSLGGSEKIFAPSAFIKSSVEKWYSGLSCMVIPHWAIQYDKAPLEDKVEENGSELTVAVIGAVTEIKGSKELIGLLNLTKYKALKWHIFGAVGDGDLLDFEGGNVNFHGRYDRRDIIRLLKEHNIQIVCLLSKTPESFGYTLTEAWLAGCAVICTNSGAVAERVIESGAGWVLNNKDPMKEAADILAAVINDHSLLYEKKKHIPHLDNLQRDVIINKYAGIYNEIIRKHSHMNLPTSHQSEKVLEAWKAQRDNSDFVLGDFAVNVAVLTSKLYFDRGNGFSERDCINTLIPAETNFSVSFIFTEPTICRQVRFDIADRYKCIVRLESAVVEYIDGSKEQLINCMHNGREDGLQIIFDTIDPNILWNVRQKAIRSVNCNGEWHICPGDILPAIANESLNQPVTACNIIPGSGDCPKCGRCILKYLKKYVKRILFRLKRKH